MMIKLTGKDLKTGEEFPIWVTAKKISFLTPQKIPGELTNGQGIPIAKVGTRLIVDGALVAVTETVDKVLEQIPEDL